MNLEKYFKTNNLEFDDECVSSETAERLVKVIEKLEKGTDTLYNLKPKDRGMTTEDIDVFLKYLVLIDFIKRNMQWQKQYLCLMGPITYAKYRKAVFDRLTTPMSIERFLDIGVEE